MYIKNLNVSTSHKTQESHFRGKLIEGNSHSGLGDERAVHHSVCHGVGVGGNSDPSPENRWVKCTEYVPWSTRKFSRKQTLGCCNGVGLPRELRPGKLKRKKPSLAWGTRRHDSTYQVSSSAQRNSGTKMAWWEESREWRGPGPWSSAMAWVV